MNKHTLSAMEFVQKYRNNELGSAVIVDVREPFEWEQYHLEEAELIPMQTIPENIEKLPTDRDVYIVCAHGVRSWHVTNYLLQQGVDNVINVEGGMAEIYIHLQAEE